MPHKNNPNLVYPYLQLGTIDLPNERWENIYPKIYDGNYQISTHGRVKSFKRSPEGQLLRQGITRKNGSGGLAAVVLHGNTRKSHSVSILVGNHFLDCSKKKKKDVFIHIDKDTLNNHYTNLKIGSTHESNILNHKLLNIPVPANLIKAGRKRWNDNHFIYIGTDIETNETIELNHQGAIKHFKKPYAARLISRAVMKEGVSFGMTWIKKKNTERTITLHLNDTAADMVNDWITELHTEMVYDHEIDLEPYDTDIVSIYKQLNPEKDA